MKLYLRPSRLALLLSLILVSGLGASAQQPAVPAENPVTIAPTGKNVSNSSENDDKEQKQIEQERQLKESTVVKKLARALGLSPRQVYWGSVILNFAITACFNDGVPPTAVYLVKPFCMAAMAASLICWGVSK